VLWVRRQEKIILKTGVPLTIELMRIALQMGVRFPERVRILEVEEVPPLFGVLRFFAKRLGLITSQMHGMSLRYGIYIRADCWGKDRLIIHELVHTWQYERFGGVSPFLKAYLHECIVTPGYPHGALEQEAQKWGETKPPWRECDSCNHRIETHFVDFLSHEDFF